MRLSRRFTLATATLALILYSASTARSDEALVVPPAPSPTPIPDMDEPMMIIPAAKLRPTEVVIGPVNSAEYRRIYDSIPFNRAEYRVNPNYRHDSAMEILTGHARHQTVIQHNYEHKQPVKVVPPPARPSRIIYPFSDSGFHLGLPFGYSWGRNW